MKQRLWEGGEEVRRKEELGAESTDFLSPKREKKQQGSGSGSHVGGAPEAGCKATSCC